jgi:hypothetical protein
VSLKVFDVRGREVACLVDGFKQPGTYEAVFDADAGQPGIYFCRYSGNGFAETLKLVLTR